MHLHDRAQPLNTMNSLMALNERAPHPDCLAKHAAAFFEMSRSSVTRFEFGLHAAQPLGL
jgi:hypothetical protein